MRPHRTTAPRANRRRRIRRRIRKWQPTCLRLAPQTRAISRTETAMIPDATTTMTPVTRTRATVSRSFMHSSLLLHCRSIPSPIALETAICGRLDIGAIRIRATTGYPAHGHDRLKWAICGRQDTGATRAAGIDTTTAIGDGILATTAELTMGRSEEHQ